jgi:DNA-binding beta-propeller fold protein YncE
MNELRMVKRFWCSQAILIISFMMAITFAGCGGGTSTETGQLTVSTLAGSAVGLDGTGAAASFKSPTDITSDGTNLYVLDNETSTIRKVVIATGVVTTLAGSGTWGRADGIGTAASFANPRGITYSNGNLYVADTGSNLIRKIVTATGMVTTLAGSGRVGAVDATGTVASFSYPWGITTDGTNLYVADAGNNTIRQIVISTGVVTTLAGSGALGAVNGTGIAASFNLPRGITTDGTNLYVADSNNITIRKIVIASGVVTTLAGTGTQGSADGTGSAASFHWPMGITTDGTNLYVADEGNSTIRQIVIASGIVTTLAGSPYIWDAVDGTGTAARFGQPTGITIDNGNLYVADLRNNIIRQIVIASGVVTTFAGSSMVDGTGTTASFNYPLGITTDGTNLYVADSDNYMIRQVGIASRVVSTLAGSHLSGSTDGIGSASSFSQPLGITTDGTNLYVTDGGHSTIRKIVISTGMVTTLAGSGTWGSADGIGTSASFNGPWGITTDGTNLYVADSGSNTIRQIVISTGAVTTLAGSVTAGLADGTGTLASFNVPQGITTDGTNLYVADAANNKIRKIVIATGVVSTFAGSGTYGGADGTGIAASFNGIEGIASDGSNLFVTDGGSTIRKIVIATRVVTTLAGSALIRGAADGIGTAATFNLPSGITTDGRRLFVADTSSGTIRMIR